MFQPAHWILILTCIANGDAISTLAGLCGSHESALIHCSYSQNIAPSKHLKRATIGPPAKRHLKALRCLADSGLRRFAGWFVQRTLWLLTPYTHI